MAGRTRVPRGLTRALLLLPRLVHTKWVVTSPIGALPLKPTQREALKIALIYAIAGVAWILLSDQVLLWLVRDPERLTQLQTYKGWAYVALTAGLLYALVCRSLRHLRAAERRAQQLQKLEALGRMAGGVAHDFNNVMTVVVGMTELARQTAPRGDVQRGHLDQVLLAAERGRDLVKNLMAFARRQPTQPQRLDLAAAVQASLPLLRKLLKSSVTLSTDLQAAAIHADPMQVEQVLMNLVVNANDAMPQGGSLKLSCSVEEPWARLEVADDGVGMDEEALSRLFEPFFSTKGEKGTGLGLATVDGIVQQLGGRIDVLSALSQGSRFILRLPLDRGPA